VAGQSVKGSKKNRKYGRNAKRSPAMARYRAEQRWLKNKKRRLRTHIERFPDDNTALQALYVL
jgi:hypothetical protein